MDYKEEYQKALERAKKGLPIDEVFPELKESDDERIMEQIVQVLIEHDWSVTYKVRRGDCIAWLEKQKEQKPTVLSDDFELALEQFLMNADSSSSTFAEDVKKYANRLREIARKEQKPMEPSDEELQRHQDELYDFRVFVAKQAKEHHISFVHDFEWNNFCAEILSYFNEQSKQEWNEEDRLMIYNIVLWLDGKYISESARMQCLEWFNKHRRDFLVRPHWKPSEEQMKALLSMLPVVKGSGDKVQDILESLYDDLSKL